jgi:hypothetical protein
MNDARKLGIFALLLTSMAVPFGAACGNKPDAKASFSLGGDGGTGATPASTTAPCQPGQPCTAQNCQPGQPCPPPSCAPGQVCAPPPGAPAPTASASPMDPNALAGLLAAAAAAGSAFLGPASAIADPAEAGLRLAAAKFAPGMSPDGQVAKGNLAEGSHVGFVANMDPNKCYTIVAFGAGMTDLDVNLLAPPLYNFLAGQDGMVGPTAVIGAAPKPMCPVLPVSVPWKVDLFAKKGAGQVAAQLYSKPK